jgi:hypothetical protein
MEATVDQEKTPAAQSPPPGIALICSDPVSRVFALRLIEKLGFPAPRQPQTLAAGLLASCKFLLLDDGDLPDDADAQLSAIATTTRIVVMSAHDQAPSIRHHAHLRKPLDLNALEAALRVADDAPSGGDEVDAGIWTELLDLFGSDGVTEMIDALRQDLPRQRERLDAALREPDARTIRQIAHSLRGAALQLGTLSLAEDWGQVEQALAGEAALPPAVGNRAAMLLARHVASVQHLRSRLRGD